MFTTVLFCLFLLCVTIQLAYALYPLGMIFQLKRQIPISQALQPVSVIICAKNEASNLEQNIPAIMAQRYGNDAGKLMYEVIVVNDASEDDTEQVLYRLSQQYSNLWSITIPKGADRNLPGKKYALSKAVPHASHGLLLLTDADCRPGNDQWLAQMVTPLHYGKQIVAGIGKFYDAPALLNKFIRWETLHTFLQYGSYALAGIPYMAVGRNLACTKDALLKAQATEEWGALPSGDDDLLVRAVGNKNNMAVVGDAFTISQAKGNWDEWVKQKQRHLSTGKYYRGKLILSLGLYASSHALMWLLFIALLFTGQWLLVMGAMACRLLVYGLLLQAAAKQMQEKDLVWYYPLFDFGWMLYNFAFSPYIIWKNKRQWK